VKGVIVRISKKAGLYVFLVALILPMLLLFSYPCPIPAGEAAIATSHYGLGHTYNFEAGLPGLYHLNNLAGSEAVATVSITGRMLYHKGQVRLVLPDKTELTVLTATDIEAGTIISTGPTGMAEIRWPDGSTILIAENTELTVIEALGYVGQKENKVLWDQLLLLQHELTDSSDQIDVEIAVLRLKLEKGSIYGSLVALGEELNGATEEAVKSPHIENSDHDHRVVVDMPWGVAGIRGTVWMNKVEDGLEITSVMTGEVIISSGGDIVSVKPGEFATVKGFGQKPELPAAMPFTEMKQWQRVSSWLDQVIASEKVVQQEIVDRVMNATEKAAQAPGQSDSAPGLTGSTPGQSGTAPGQSGSAPGLTGNTPGLSGTTPGQSGSAPGLIGSTPGQSGATPGQSGSSPGNSGNAPGQNK